MEEGEIKREDEGGCKKKKKGEQEGEREHEKERLLKTSAESVMPAVAQKGKEEKRRGRESSRGGVGEKCSEMNTPLKSETLCVGLTQILRATQTYSSNSPCMLLCSSIPADFLMCTYLSPHHSSSVILSWSFFFFLLPRVGNLDLKKDFESMDPIHGIM